MTDNEKNMVHRMKMLVIRMIIDLDDEMILEILEIIKKAAKQKEDSPC